MLLRLDGFDAYHEERGGGDPLVLVHGLGASTRIWDRVAGLLAERFRVIAYDLRGLGRSGAPPPPCTLDDLVADLDRLADALALERFVLVGHSLGGAIALRYALDVPERVRALVGIAAPSVTTAEQRQLLAERAAAATRHGMEALAELHAAAGLPDGFTAAHPETTAFYKGIIASGDPGGYAALCLVTADLDLEPRLGTLRPPVLLVAGQLDRVVRPESVRATAAAIPGARYAELAGCGHVAPLEQPEELVRHILDFAALPAPAAR